MELYVIEQIDGQDSEVSVIGVASDPDHARRMIKEYYGEESRLIVEHDIRSDGIEFTQVVAWDWNKEAIRDTVIVRYMYLNEV